MKVVIVGTTTGEHVDAKELAKIVANQDTPPICVSLNILNQVNELIIKEKVKWNEQETINEWKLKPENVRKMSEFSAQLFLSFGREWFTVKQMVQKHFCNENYRSCRDVLDLQFAIGFLAMKNDKKAKQMVFRVIPDPIEKLDYIQDTITAWTSKIQELHTLEQEVAQEVIGFRAEQEAEAMGMIRKEVDKMSREELIEYIKLNKIKLRPTSKWKIETIRDKICVLAGEVIKEA